MEKPVDILLTACESCLFANEGAPCDEYKEKCLDIIYQISNSRANIRRGLRKAVYDAFEIHVDPE